MPASGETPVSTTSARSPANNTGGNNGGRITDSDAPSIYLGQRRLPVDFPLDNKFSEIGLQIQWIYSPNSVNL